ncbi:metalloprotein [Vespertiliibacter pulmonis]|nr:VOC family protein [Vespertiliibacter pulmonis]QLB20653.1 metalloprotein [Vespertiliibacter pulmonis]
MILKNPTENSQFANFLANLTACFGNLSQFEQKIQEIADIAQLNLTQFEIDHLAVRMNNLETAQQWHMFLSMNANLLKQSEVNGRPISLFKLHQPLEFYGQSVSIIELPYPKNKIYPQEGWEHIEIVVPFLANESVEQWVSRLNDQFQFEQNPQLNVKISQPLVENERLPNPTIAISLKGTTNQNYCCLKLHPYDINAIILSEIII